MSTTNDFGYDYVFELAKQLTPEEKAKLAQSLQADAVSSKREPEPKRKMSPEEYYELLMNGPVLSEEEIQLMLDAKETVNQCQPISF